MVVDFTLKKDVLCAKIHREVLVPSFFYQKNFTLRAES